MSTTTPLAACARPPEEGDPASASECWAGRGGRQGPTPSRPTSPRPSRVSRRGGQGEAHVPAQQPQAGQKSWVSSPYVDTRRPSDRPGPAEEGPTPAVCVIPSAKQCHLAGRGESPIGRHSRPFAARRVGYVEGRSRYPLWETNRGALLGLPTPLAAESEELCAAIVFADGCGPSPSTSARIYSPVPT